MFLHLCWMKELRFFLLCQNLLRLMCVMLIVTPCVVQAKFFLKFVVIWTLLQIHIKSYFNHTLHLYRSFRKFPFIPVPTENPVNCSPVIQQINTVTFVALNKSARNFDGLNHQNTPEKHSHQSIADMNVTMGKQPLYLVAYFQRHERKVVSIKCFLYGIVLGWFFRVHGISKNGSSASSSFFKKHISSLNFFISRTWWSWILNGKRNWKFKSSRPESWKISWKKLPNESAAVFNLICNELSAQRLPEKLKTCDHKWQVKHTTTVMEPSSPFHTVVKLVDAGN